jgi:glutamate synthase (ferredoxin)
MVVDIKGRKSNRIVREALSVLVKMKHRGALGSEPNTGDGAGILFQIPHAFLAAKCAALGFALPDPGNYGVGMLFLPRDPDRRVAYEMQVEAIIRREGQKVLGWRTVPTDDSTLGATARSAEPFIRQVFIGKSLIRDEAVPERVLYVIRRAAENAIRQRGPAMRSSRRQPLRSHYHGQGHAHRPSGEFYPI